MTNNGSFRRNGFVAMLVLLVSPLAVQAQFVDDVNGLFIEPRIFNFFPNSSLTITEDYPTSAIIDDRDLGAGIGFANRHDLIFSSDGGTTPRTFNNQDPFDISVDILLETGADVPRKEAGIRVNFGGFDGLFIVNSDAGEIVAFSDPLEFFSFDATFGISYTTGSSINLRMVYNPPDPVDPETTPGTIEYLVDYDGDSFTSGPIQFTNVEGGILDGSELGVYAQGGAAAENPNDFFTATFTNFMFGEGTAPVGLPGDYNDNGIVDTADYTLWRDNLGTTNELANDPIGGEIGPAQYDQWRTNFARMVGNANAGTVNAIPEPAGLAMGVIGLVALLGLGRRRR